MLSSKSIGSGGGAAAYYENLAREDYYTAGGEPPGQWVGEYAREIGLAGEVQKGELEAAFAGFHPRTGEQIANNAGSDHKAGYDLTFSAPKSVSMTWATADRETQQAISQAQQRAVEKALDYASKHAFHQREGHAGAIKVEHTSGIAAATFEHGTSREGDPQLHTHALVANLAENGKRIDFDTSWKHAAGAAYRAELASEMQKLGYNVERDGTSFKIDGVPDKLEREFSTRREQIEASMREHGTHGGKAAQAAALATRETKGEVNRAELFERTREVAREHGFDPAAIRSGDAIEPEKFDSASFLDAATAQASTLTRPQLEKEMLQAAQGSLTIEKAQAKLEALKARGELIELRDNAGGPNRWTTREMLAIEKNIADTSARMALEKTHEVSRGSLEAATAKKSLSDDQKQALSHIAGPERIAVVQGVAGAGKSYMLDAARDAWERDGYTVRGAALAGKAAEGLQQSSGIHSETIHKTLGMLDTEQIKLDSKTIVVVDEAGMLGSRLYERLQQHVDAAGAKLVLVGDIQQLQPIDAGGAMRSVQERVGSVVMDEIRRQHDPEQRQIVRDFKDGKADAAIDRLEKLNQVKTYETATGARSGMASAIVKDMADGKTSIGLAGTRAEVHQINQHARAEAQQAGLVSDKNHEFKTERGARQFADGDRVIFLENNRLDAPRGGVGSVEVKNGTTGTVEKASDGVLRVNLDNGKTVMVREDKYRQIDHGYAMTVHKSQGVTVDRAHLMPGRMTDQHSAYVGASRHRETVQIHGTAEQIKEMRQTASKEHTKDTSADQRYTPIERQQAEPWKPQHDHRQAPPTERQIEKLEQARESFDQRAAELRQASADRHAEPKQAEQRPESERQQSEADRQHPDEVKPEPKQAEQAKPEAERQQPEAKPEADRQHPDEVKPEPKQAEQTKPEAERQQPDPKQPEQAKPEAERQQVQRQPEPQKQQTQTAKPAPKQAEQQRQLKHEAQRHQQGKPAREAEQKQQLKTETARQQQKQPERQAEQKQPERQPERQHERDR